MKNKILLGACALCLIVVLCAVLVMCSGGVWDAEPTTGATVGGEPVTYTVQVQNQGGLFLPDVGVYVYEDDTLAELVWFAKTDDSGKMTFTDTASDSYVAVLTDVPTGYAVEAMYPITGELTQIILSAGQMSDDVTELTYQLGDMMMDFTVEDAAGDTYTLSKLLERKKAVVLNFWLTTCQPCKAEFPFLQEAYEQYSEGIAVLAMNPVNTPEEVAKFQEEMGLTFPMMACDPEWAQIMGITAYPTTVVIDRYGNITLIHMGSIDNAKTFADTFAYFAAEDYQQKLIRDITELVTEEEEGTEENPIEIGGVLNFEVTVKPGQTVYSEVYKVTGMYMQAQGDHFKLLYNEKEYTPTNGVVGLVVTTGDTRTPAKIGITNTGNETATYQVAFSFLPGTMDNPYAMKLGQFEVSVSAGNEKGVYYTYRAAEDGTLTVQCLSASAGVEYGYTLYNLESSAQRTLSADGGKDDNGVPTLSIQARKGQTVQLTVSTLPDGSGSYPAGTFKLLASFAAGEIEEEEKIEKIPYTVTVKDAQGEPIPNVSITVAAEGEPAHFATDATGVAVMQLPAGTYTCTFTVPEGYDPVENTEFALTAENTDYEITLTKTVIIMHDYVVTVADEKGGAVSGTKVKIGSTVVTTGSDGTAVFQLEQGSYTVTIQELPEDYTAAEDAYPFPEGETALRIVLDIKPGTAGNPYQVSEYPFDTASIGGTAQHYVLSNAGGMVLNILNDAAYVIYDGTTYGPVEGLVSVPLADGQAQAKVVIGNSKADEGSMRFTLRLSYPVGAKENPEVLEQLGQTTVDLAAGNTKGYHYTWTAEEEGTVHFRIDSITQGAGADIILTVGDTTAKLSDTQGASEVSVWVTPEAVVGIHVITTPDQQTGQIPAAQIVVDGEFRLPPNSAEYPDVLTDISRFDATLEAGDADGYYYIWTPANSGVAAFKIGSITEGVTGDIILSVKGSETVVKLSDGMKDDGQPVAAITVARGDTVSIQVTAAAQAAQITVSGSLTQDANSAQNPDVITDITAIHTNLVSGDPDGHYYIWNAAYSGEVSFRIGSITQGVQGNITLCVNGGEQIVGTAGTVSTEVKVGDEVLIHVTALADSQTGEHPAAQITAEGSFIHVMGSSYNPEAVTDISQLTVNLAAGDADGYYYSWTATENANAVFHIAQAKLGGAAVTGDPAERVDIELYVNGSHVTSLSENEAKDSAGNRIVSVSVRKDDLVTIRVTTREASRPEAAITVKSHMEISYSVTVTDMLGKVFADVAVAVRDAEGRTVHTASTNASGMVSFTAPAGSYTVELAFEGTAYYYNEAAAVLTAGRPSLTIRLATYMDTTATFEDLWALNGAVTYVLQPGSTYVEIGANKPYYCEEQEGSCLFIFHPTQGGTYKFSVDDPNVEISYRNSPFFVFEIASSEGTADNSFTYSVGNSTAGNINMIIGVKAVEGVEGVVINITRVGEPDWSVENEPWDEAWKQNTAHGAACQSNVTGLTYLDVNAPSGTYELYYDEAAGFYRLYQGGPVIYVDLNSSRFGISLYKIIHGDGLGGGAPIRRYFYDENGVFVKREDYTETLDAYFTCAGLDAPAKAGYHPLTKELAYILQNGGCDWWNSSSPSKNEQLVAANPEYAWMFLCGYIG